MSARPRPVTATIRPPSMDPPTGVRERRYSLSSGSSTASLVSVLDHDSYESPGTDSEDERERIAQLNVNNSGKPEVRYMFIQIVNYDILVYQWMKIISIEIANLI